MLTGALVRGALQSQLQLVSEPQEVLKNLNGIAWASSPSKESAAMFLARIDPATGQIESASAGHVDAYILRPHGWEPIVTDGMPLGVDTDIEYVANRHQVAPGDVLLAISDRNPDGDSGLDTTRIAETLLRHLHLPPKDLTKLACHLIRRQVDDQRTRCVVIVKRREDG
jgi:serine phosphatase RsbU (regulator of sigma subunit)